MVSFDLFTQTGPKTLLRLNLDLVQQSISTSLYLDLEMSNLVTHIRTKEARTPIGESENILSDCTQLYCVS